MMNNQEKELYEGGYVQEEEGPALEVAPEVALKIVAEEPSSAFEACSR